MRSLTILLVALVAVVGLCKGAAVENEDDLVPYAEMMSATGVDCKQAPALCGRKKREIEEDSPVEPAETRPGGLCPGSLCSGRKKRDVGPEGKSAGTWQQCNKWASVMVLVTVFLKNFS